MLQRLALVFFSVFVVAVAVVVTNVPKVDAQEVDNTTKGRFKVGGGWGDELLRQGRVR